MKNLIGNNYIAVMLKIDVLLNEVFVKLGDVELFDFLINCYKIIVIKV